MNNKWGFILNIYIPITLLCLLYSSYDNFNRDKGAIYYKSFDIFNLKGVGSLKKLNKNESVAVSYENGVPISVKYYNSNRTITILLVDSFVLSNKTIYVYNTSNFFGGQPGRQKVYSFHSEEHKDILYVSKSDTIICQTENVPKDKNFTFHLLIKKPSGMVSKYTMAKYDFEGNYSKLSISELYPIWLDSLIVDYQKGVRMPELFNNIPE